MDSETRRPQEEALPTADFLTGGGLMGAAIRGHDWSGSPLGPPERWPQSLRTALNIMLNSGHPMFLAWGPELIFIFNDAYRPILGGKLPHALGERFEVLWADIWPDLTPAVERALAGEASWVENQKLVMQRHGYDEETYFNYSYSPLRDESGGIAGLFCACTETTETVLTTRRLRATEAALRQANQELQAERERVQATNRRLLAETEHLRRLFEQAPSFIAIVRGSEHVFELANQAYLRLVGKRTLVGKPVREALPEIEGQGFFELLDRVYDSGQAVVRRQEPLAIQRERGGPIEERFVDFVYQPILDPDETIAGIFVEGFDVTERVHAERELRRFTETLEEQVEARTRDLREAEAALRQAQKMEAVGQLTGGIAHDFNNLLLGISGSLTLAQRRLAKNEPEGLQRLLELAMNSTERAAALTHRLLAFSRRQPLTPKRVQVAALVLPIEDLLRRTLGESISLELALAADSLPVECDPNQLESALLNLVINARDAMPDGGRLRIGTDNVSIDGGRGALEPGHYLCLSVSDTGTGMPAKVRERAFDPFFTTKPTGQGTGLGLSMVYGFARQSGGYVEIDSEPEHGTCVRLYLPRSERAPEAEEAPPAPPGAADGERVVLVVEDERTVRELIVEVLREQGYRALSAADGGEGLQLLQTNPQIDLVVTDIGLPGLNGRQMVDAARTGREELPVLFMTGYAEKAAAADFLAPGMELISKPFQIEALLNRIAEMLRSEPPQGAG